MSLHMIEMAMHFDLVKSPLIALGVKIAPLIGDSYS